MSEIKLLVPDMPRAEALAPYLRRIDAARWYTNFGPLVRELEARLAAQFGPEQHAVTMSSATSGLELTLVALGLAPGARVLLPDFTFVATATSILRAGLVPVVADIDARSWLLTPGIARGAIESRLPDAVMPVATFGCPQDADDWDRFSDDTGIPVVIDAAGGFGNQRAGRRVHAVFSLHATKSLGAGEGGFLVSRDLALVERVRRLTNFGIDPATGIVDVPGTNAKLSEYHAAVGLAALDDWPRRREARRNLWRSLLSLLRGRCPALEVQARPQDGTYTIAPVLLPQGLRGDDVLAALAAAGIQTRRWYYPPLSRHPGFAAVEQAGEMEGVDLVAGRVVGVPFHLELGAADLERIATALAQALPQGG